MKNKVELQNLLFNLSNLIGNAGYWKEYDLNGAFQRILKKINETLSAINNILEAEPISFKTFQEIGTEMKDGRHIFNLWNIYIHITPQNVADWTKLEDKELVNNRIVSFVDFVYDKNQPNPANAEIGLLNVWVK